MNRFLQNQDSGLSLRGLDSVAIQKGHKKGSKVLVYV